MTELHVNDSVLAEIAAEIDKLKPASNGNHCFRFVTSDTGDPELALDAIRPSDRQFAYHGKTVLVIAASLARQYAGRTLDLNAAGDFVLI